MKSEFGLALVLSAIAYLLAAVEVALGGSTIGVMLLALGAWVCGLGFLLIRLLTGRRER